ncbi:MAG: twin-arginine translocase subunit TatC [Anaerolineae bacterium]
MPDILSIILIFFAALIIIGPRRLPESLEALWLAVTDYSRTQKGLPPLGSMHNARIFWKSEKNNVYTGIQLLYQFTVHLEELRYRVLIAVVALTVTFLAAFFFSQQLLGLIIQPISSGIPLKPVDQAPVNEYVLARDTQVTAQVQAPSGTVSETITLSAGTPLPLTLPSPRPVFMHPTELFSTYIKISVLAAVGLSLPVLLWQLLMFFRGPKLAYARLGPSEWQVKRATLTAPALADAEQQRQQVYEGLTAQEMRPLYVIIPLSLVLFIAGVLFTYYLVLPAALDFLFGMGGNLVQALPSLDDYIDFALALIFWVGVSFELPLIMFFLARFKLITWQQFARQWRYAVVIIVVIAAVITPTTDAFNMSLVAAPMLLLYVMGIALARFA